MFSFAKLKVQFIFAVLMPVSFLASASGAVAQQHCEGTLCDLYYGTSSSFDDKPVKAPPTPVMAPHGTILGMFTGSNTQQPTAPGTGPAAPTQKSFVGVGGGGLAAMARGEKVDRCSGTLCDLYYGKSSSFEDVPAQAQAQAPAVPGARVAETASEPATQAAAEPHGFEEHPQPSRCASAARDPWSCYR